MHRRACTAQIQTPQHSCMHGRLRGTAVGIKSFNGRQLAIAAPARQIACRSGMVVEANLFSRFFRVIRSYANSIVGAAEDPEKILDQAVNEMQSDLIKMRQAAAQVVGSQKQLEAKYAQASDTADQWYRRAELALQKGDDELAREALKRRKAYEDNAKVMKVQLDAQNKAVDQLKGNTRMLESKLAEAKSKKDTLKARAKSAATSKQIQEMIQGLNTSNAATAFERMEEKLASSDELESKFNRLEGDDVDDELASMKKGLLKGGSRSGPSSKQSLPEGRPVKSVPTHFLLCPAVPAEM
eukprot:jgi/Astpho2/3303/Aster-04654